MTSYQADNRYLEVGGTAYEMAYKQGRAFLSRFDAIFRSLTRAPFLPPWLGRLVPVFVWRRAIKRLGHRYLRRHAPLLENFNGRNHLNSLRGLATGFKLGKEQLYGMNALEIVTAHMPFSLGCTSIAFGPEETASGRPKLGYNHDFPDSFGEYLYVQKNMPRDGYESLCLTYPVILGAIAGINSEGLAISLNHAFATDFDDKPAVLFTLLLQECLRSCRHVADALDLIAGTPVPNGSILTLMDATGNRVAVEFSCTKRSHRYPGGGILHSFNCYQQSELKDVEVPLGARPRGMARWILKERKIHDHNLARHRRFDGLVDPAKKFADEDIHRLLSDHGDAAGDYDTICRHDARTISTIASVILSPADRRMKVIYGRPCSGSYCHYSLKEPEGVAA